MFCTYSTIGGHRWDEGNELHLKTVIAKFANLFKYVRKSTKATENLEEEKRMEFPIDKDLLSS